MMSTVALLCSVVGGGTGEAFGGDRTRSSGDMLTDRQTDRQTRSSQYSARCDIAEGRIRRTIRTYVTTALPTVLCAAAEDVDDVVMTTDHLHHFHLV